MAQNDLNSSITSQAIETDADINGFIYTRQFLQIQAKHFRSTTPGSGGDKEAMRSVWSHILNTTEGLRFVSLTGTFVALLSFCSEGETIARLKDRTHPMSAARIFALLQADSQLAKSTNKDSRPNFDAVLFSVSLFAFILMAYEALKAPEHLEKGLQSITLEKVLESFGISESFNNINALESHYNDLAARMRQLHRTREIHRHMDDYLRYIWF